MSLSKEGDKKKAQPKIQTKNSRGDRVMRVYLTDLKAYNEGNLVGEWLELPMHVIELESKLTEILERGSELSGYGEKHKEYFITDYECDFSINEYANLDTLNEMASIISRLDEDEKRAINFLMSNHIVKDFDEALDKLDEVIIHEDSSMEDIAYDLIQDCYGLNDIPEIIANNIDYESIGRDLSMDGCYFEEGNTIFEYRG